MLRICAACDERHEGKCDPKRIEAIERGRRAAGLREALGDSRTFHDKMCQARDLLFGEYEDHRTDYDDMDR